MCVNPSNQDDRAETALRDFTNESPPNCLALETVVEGGVRANL